MGGRAATPAASCRNCLRGSFTAPPPKKRGLQTPGDPQNSYRFDFQYCEPADGTRAATEKGISARPAGSSALRYANHAIGGSGCVGCLSSLCRLLALIGPTEMSAIPLLSGAKRASAIA